jgi:glycosyltransferase involved in cell wall biosynthesis
MFHSLFNNLLRQNRPVARVLQISNYPPPLDGWAIHVVNMQRALEEHGVDSQVMDIGPGRLIKGRNCVTVQGAFDYLRKLFAYRCRGFIFEPHVNGDSWKGFFLGLSAVSIGRLTGKPAVLMLHAGPSQLYFPRLSGIWYHMFRLMFHASGEIICNSEPVKEAIIGYGVPEQKVHPIFSVKYPDEKIPVPLPTAVDKFLGSHEPRLFSYTLFRPEFTNEALFLAFAGVSRRYPQAGLLIAGSREVPEEVRSRLKELRIEPAIMIAGNLPHPEFLTALQRCDVFIRTHLRDGLCASVLEALRLGVPVVAAEDGMRPPSVITFAPGDGADLECKLSALLDDLDSARACVIRPNLGRSIEEEVALLLSVANVTRR